MRQLSKTVRQRVSTIPNALELIGDQMVDKVNAAGCMDLGVVQGTTAPRPESLIMTSTEIVSTYTRQQGRKQTNS